MSFRFDRAHRRLVILSSHLSPARISVPSITRDPCASRFNPSNTSSATGTRAAEDELDLLVRRAEEIRRIEEQEERGIRKPRRDIRYPRIGFLPYLIVPTFREESRKSGEENRALRRRRVKILYDVSTARAQAPAFLDVSLDDAKTPLAFRYIRIVLLTAEARRAQDIHWDQYAFDCMSVAFTTPLGVTGRLVIRGAVVQSIIYYLAFYDLMVAGKGMPGPVRDYTLRIKVLNSNHLDSFSAYSRKLPERLFWIIDAKMDFKHILSCFPTSDPSQSIYQHPQLLLLFYE